MFYTVVSEAILATFEIIISTLLSLSDVDFDMLTHQYSILEVYFGWAAPKIETQPPTQPPTFFECTTFDCFKDTSYSYLWPEPVKPEVPEPVDYRHYLNCGMLLLEIQLVLGLLFVLLRKIFNYFRVLIFGLPVIYLGPGETIAGRYYRTTGKPWNPYEPSNEIGTFVFGAIPDPYGVREFAESFLAKPPPCVNEVSVQTYLTAPQNDRVDHSTQCTLLIAANDLPMLVKSSGPDSKLRRLSACQALPKASALLEELGDCERDRRPNRN